jgi:hypothetical protein
MDAINGFLMDALRSRQASHEDDVDDDRVAATENVFNKKELSLTIIEELIWNLGYGSFESLSDTYYDRTLMQDYSDYSYKGLQYAQESLDNDGHNGLYGLNKDFNFYYPGKNEEHDLVVRNQIVDQKEYLFGVIEKTLNNSAQRVVDELAEADEAYDNAIADFEAEARRLIDEMNAAISAAIDSFNETLADAKAAMEAETDRAEAALEDMLQSRLADWKEKYDWEV